MRRIFLGKLTVTQLVMKFPTFVWNLKVHRLVHKSSPLVPNLNQRNLVTILPNYFFKIYFIIVLPSTNRSSRWSLPFGIPTNILNLLTSPMRAIFPTYLTSLDLITLIIFGEEYNLRSSPLRNFLQYFFTSFLLGPKNIVLSI